MNEGLEALTEQIKKLQQTVDANHTMLVSAQRRAQVSILLSSLKWFIILGITFGSFYYIQPYLENLFGVYTSIQELSSPFPKNNVGTTSTESVNQAEGLINSIRSYMPR